VAGIILAAGESSRFGEPKQLLDWRGRPFVVQVALEAIAAGLSPVIVVVGANAEQITPRLQGIGVVPVHNPEWRSGQASSIHRGLEAVLQAQHTQGSGVRLVGGAVFLLADQPQIGATVISALVATHATDLDRIVVPLVPGGQRANPVLFDRATFPALMALQGDIGGRAIFSQFRIHYMPWHDERLLEDVDDPAGYARLLDLLES
jgi:molybdenum cofactor cytidylyltransferase